MLQEPQKLQYYLYFIGGLKMNDIKSTALESIAYEDIKSIVTAMLKEHASKETLQASDELHSLLHGLLIHRGVIHEDQPQQGFEDVLAAACLLHNIHPVEKPSDLFFVRDLFEQYNAEFTLPQQIIDAICASIEGKFGVNSPVKSCIPQQGTPTAMFADACWMQTYMKNLATIERI